MKNMDTNQTKRERTNKENKPLCFVIQPFDDTYNKRYRCGYKPELEKYFRVERIDEDSTAQDLIIDIKERIRRAHVCFADVSEHNNPNVWFELGYADALKRPLILVCSEDRNRKLPFDISTHHVVFYNSSIFDNNDSEGISEFRKKLSATAKKRRNDLNIEVEDKSFRKWCDSRLRPLSCSVPSPEADLRKMIEERPFVQVGDSMLLLASRYADGYPDVHLRPQNVGIDQQFKENLRRRLPIAHYEAWDKRVKELGEMKGRKLRVRKVFPDLSDEPLLTLEAEEVSYVHAKSFHDVAITNRGIPKRNLSEAFQVFSERGTALPNILVNHMIVVFGPEEDLKLLIAHRQTQNRQSGYLPGRWSVSFEEQYSYFEDRVGNMVMPRDNSIVDSIERGVREEFLGKSYPRDHIDISVQGFQMETYILNFGFLAVVRLRNLQSFDELKELWIAAEDYYEHCEIAAMPLCKEKLQKCLESPHLPKDIYLELPKWPTEQLSQADDSQWEEENRWHPTAQMRIALALWYLEEQVENR